jgi:hypothetical protein
VTKVPTVEEGVGLPRDHLASRGRVRRRCPSPYPQLVIRLALRCVVLAPLCSPSCLGLVSVWEYDGSLRHPENKTSSCPSFSLMHRKVYDPFPSWLELGG